MLAGAAVPGIVLGSIYALVAAGLTITFGVLKIVNFAHGEFVMLSMYATLIFVRYTNIDPYVLIPLNFLVFLGLGMLVQRTLIRSVLHLEESVHILVTVGLMLVLQNGALMLFKSDIRTLESPYHSINLMLPGIGVGLNAGKALAFAVAIVAMVLLAAFLSRSLVGTAMRALAQDREATRLVGINTELLDTFSFGLGIALAAVGGTVLAVFYPIYPLVGLDFILKSFAIVVLGGMGTIVGSLVGGLVIGVIESMSQSLFQGGWETLIIYSLFLVMLLVRPQGLFGKATTR